MRLVQSGRERLGALFRWPLGVFVRVGDVLELEEFATEVAGGNIKWGAWRWTPRDGFGKERVVVCHVWRGVCYCCFVAVVGARVSRGGKLAGLCSAILRARDR